MSWTSKWLTPPWKNLGRFLNPGALLPSLRYFEDVGHIPRLSYRISEETGSEGPWTAWKPWTPSYQRRLQNLFLNPQGTFELAKVTLLERFVEGVRENDAADPVEAELTSRLVEDLIRKTHPDFRGPFEFKIDLESQDPSQANLENVITASGLITQSFDQPAARAESP